MYFFTVFISNNKIQAIKKVKYTTGTVVPVAYFTFYYIFSLSVPERVLIFPVLHGRHFYMLFKELAEEKTVMKSKQLSNFGDTQT